MVLIIGNWYRAQLNELLWNLQNVPYFYKFCTSKFYLHRFDWNQSSVSIPQAILMVFSHFMALLYFVAATATAFAACNGSSCPQAVTAIPPSALTLHKTFTSATHSLTTASSIPATIHPGSSTKRSPTKTSASKCNSPSKHPTTSTSLACKPSTVANAYTRNGAFYDIPIPEN